MRIKVLINIHFWSPRGRLSSWGECSEFPGSYDTQELIAFANCVVQGVGAGILIQQNLYAGNMKGKTRFSIPFVVLFIALAFNIGTRSGWRALGLSLPGTILVILD